MSRTSEPLEIFFPTGVKNNVAAAVAAAMLQDFRINRFAFSGFPGVSTSVVGSGLQVRISADGHTAGPLTIEAPIAVEIAEEFAAQGHFHRGFFRNVQSLLYDLEGLVQGEAKTA